MEQENPPDEIWTTHDGKQIAVGDMSESHVRNVLRMILRNRRREAAKLISTQHDDDFAFSDGDRYWYYPSDRTD